MWSDPHNRIKVIMNIKGIGIYFEQNIFHIQKPIEIV
jgi:hypothetical protein